MTRKIIFKIVDSRESGPIQQTIEFILEHCVFYYICVSILQFCFLSSPMYLLVYWNLFTQSLYSYFCRRASNQIYWFPISIVPTVRVVIWTVSHTMICASQKSVIMAPWRRRNQEVWEWNVNYLLQIILLDINSNITTKDITKNNC